MHTEYSRDLIMAFQYLGFRHKTQRNVGTEFMFKQVQLLLGPNFNESLAQHKTTYLHMP